MNNSVLFTSYFYIFLLVVVFVFWHSSIPVWLDISFFGINLKEERKAPILASRGHMLIIWP